MIAPIRVGIIGAGDIARNHVLAYQQLPDVEIVGVADIVPGRAAAFAKQFNIPLSFTSYHDLLNMPEIEAVDVCTYNQAHRQPTVDALTSGKHVLVEKPLAAKLDDAIAMISASEKTGKILHTAFWTRWQPNMQVARKIVQSGELGDVYYVQMVGGGRRRIPGGSFLRRETAGAGPIVDIGCYDLDAFMFLMDSPCPVSVSAMISYNLGKTLPNVLGDWEHSPAEMEVEDFATAFVRFDNGLALHFVTYWAAHAATLGPSMFLGTRGGLQLSPQIVLFRDEFGAMTDVTPQIPDTTEPERMNHFRPQARVFIDAVRAGGPTPVATKGILYSQLIMDGIFRSAETRQEVSIELPML
jgi:predicted dehydrogenase